MPFCSRLSSDLIRSINFAGDRLRAPRMRRIFPDAARIPDSVPFTVYFAGTPNDLYQLDQWIDPLGKLAFSAGAVVLLITNPRSASAISKAADLPVVFCPTSDSVEAFVRRHSVQAIMYVNNNQANFTTLRINGPAHVHISHGESEKSSMTSNQLKAYDYALIAGQASEDRILRSIKRIDSQRLIQIGRPQFDSVRPLDLPAAPGRIRVLYAPTWEGDGKQMVYGSLEASGEEIIEELLSDARIQLIFRPHPKSGTASNSYARSLSNAKKRIKTANAAGATIHFVDTSANGISTIKACDIVISDTSAMSMDALGMNVPLVLTVQDKPKPSNETENNGASPQLRDAIPTLDLIPKRTLPIWLIEQAASGASTEQRQYREYVFGNTETASDTERFIRAMQSATSETPSNC